MVMQKAHSFGRIFELFVQTALFAARQSIDKLAHAAIGQAVLSSRLQKLRAALVTFLQAPAKLLLARLRVEHRLQIARGHVLSLLTEKHEQLLLSARQIGE